MYKISENYIEFLRETDPVNVKYNKNQRRPYIGIVLELNQILYFAPLASPKSKHIKMKNSLDFIKIGNGKLGAINLNNMIPVPQEAILELSKLYIKNERTATGIDILIGSAYNNSGQETSL